MLDLNACNLFISTILFFFPGIVFLVLAARCGYHSNGGRPAEKFPRSHYCSKIDEDTSVIMLCFGVIFLLLGMLIAIFAVLIQISNGHSRKKTSNQGKTVLCC